MNATAIRPVDSGELEAEGSVEGTEIRVRLRGSAELGAKAALDEFLSNVFEASEGCDVVVVDIRKLEFMNSSCFKSLLTWLVKVQALPEERRHMIRFQSNPKYHWQKRSLHSLASMGGGLVEVEETAEVS
jgi:hypothetical protein